MTLLLAGSFPQTSSAQSLDSVATVTRTFAIENALVVRQPGQTLSNATVIIRDGLIQDVGQNLAIPFDAERIAGDSLTVYAGFIDGLSHAGMPKPESPRQSNSNDEKIDRSNPPNDRAGIQPERSALDLLDSAEKSVAALRAAGFTAAHVVPNGQMLPGKGAVILLAGNSPHEMLIKNDVSMFAQLAGARGVYPATPMGVMAKMRQLYREASRRKTVETLYASNASNMQRPDYDEAHAALFPVISGELPVFMHTSGPLDIYRALRLKEQLGFPMILSGLYGGFEYIDLLLDADLPLFLTLKMPKEQKKKNEEKKDDAAQENVAAYNPALHVTDHTNTETERINLEERRKIFEREYLANAATMYDAGLNFGFSTKEVKPGEIHGNIRKMLENGLSKDVALAALTTIPARTLGLSRSMGSVEKGKMANLVVTRGTLFDKASKIRYVFVNGQKFEYNNGENQEKAKEEENDSN